MEFAKLSSNYITTDLIGLSKMIDGEFSVGKITPDYFAKLITRVSGGELSSRGAKDILKIMFEVGGDPEIIAKEKGLMQKNNEKELEIIIEKILESNSKTVQEYKNGKESVLQFFVGQAMRETKGSANPEILKKIILEFLQK